MSEFLQGLFACLVAAMFSVTVLVCFMCRLSGGHSAAERIEEDRHQYFQQGDLARRRQTWRARG